VQVRRTCRHGAAQQLIYQLNDRSITGIFQKIALAGRALTTAAGVFQVKGQRILRVGAVVLGLVDPCQRCFETCCILCDKGQWPLSCRAPLRFAQACLGGGRSQDDIRTIQYHLLIAGKDERQTPLCRGRISHVLL
jgi:hypothetical protein